MPTSFPGSLRRVGENPRLQGRLALFLNLDQKSDGLWERECLGELVPMRSNETGATTTACRLNFRKCATSKMRRSTDVFILRLGRIKFTSYAVESSIFVKSEALNSLRRLRYKLKTAHGTATKIRRNGVLIISNS